MGRAPNVKSPAQDSYLILQKIWILLLSTKERDQKPLEMMYLF